MHSLFRKVHAFIDRFFFRYGIDRAAKLTHEVKTPLAKMSLAAEMTSLEIDQVMKGQGSAEKLLPKIQRRMKYIMDQAFLAGHRVDALQQISSSKQPASRLQAGGGGRGGGLDRTDNSC